MTLQKLPTFLKSVLPKFRVLSSSSSSGIGEGATIYALSSSPGKSGVAVIRVSGQRAAKAVTSIVGGGKFPVARKATLRRFYNPSTREPIDRGLLLWFPGPRSFTGEDCAEFHVHGGLAVISAMLAALGSLPGFRHAEQGEFTKRAFLNDKLDLTEVEGIGDLIHAETESQRKQALRQMEGDLGKLYSQWRRKLIQCMANVEAFIDFGEDENIEDDVMDKVQSEINDLIDSIKLHLSDSRQGERLRSGVKIAMIGKPNVGKSTLLNKICQRPAAIVSPVAGTTRDVIETAVNIGGYPALLADTAGLRSTEEVIEKEGVNRALQRAADADLNILMIDHQSNIVKTGTSSSSSLTESVQNHLSELGLGEQRSDQVINRTTEMLDNSIHSSQTDENGRDEISGLSTKSEVTKECFKGTSPTMAEMIVVVNKSDLMSDRDREFIEDLRSQSHVPVCVVSCQTGMGFDHFIDKLHENVKKLCGNDPLSGNPNLTKTRHRTHLTNCLQFLINYQKIQDGDVVIAAQQLRKASREIGKIIGKINAEDVLNVLFKDFCIGK